MNSEICVWCQMGREHHGENMLCQGTSSQYFTTAKPAAPTLDQRVRKLEKIIAHLTWGRTLPYEVTSDD